MSNHKDAWERIKGYANTRELSARTDHAVLGSLGDWACAEAYLDIVEYMKTVEAEYGLVSEASPNRKR